MVRHPSLALLLGSLFAVAGCPSTDSLDDDDVADDDTGDDDTSGDPCEEFAAAAAAVDADRLLETMQWLTDYPRRDGFGEQDEILDILAGDLEDFGAAVDFHSYSHAGQTHRNLVAKVPASAPLGHDEPHLVIGAHVDSTSENGAAQAPGADDNASGVAAVLETVRILAQCELDTRIDFVFFTNEEIGTVGSEAYAGDAAALDEDIVGMMAVDMVAFGPDGEDLDVATKSDMGWLAAGFAEGVEAYTGTQVVLKIDDHCG
jgi:hypothetical protein